MTISHVICNVEQFRGGGWPGQDDCGSLFVDEVRLTGWFLSHAEIVSVELASGGKLSGPLAVEDFRRPSDGIHGVYGSMFGERARHCRFAVTWPMPDRTDDVSGARLRVAMADGHVFERALGPMVLDHARGGLGPDASELVMSFESIGDNCEFGLVQRRVGIERMSLLRYAGVLDVRSLADVLARRLDGFGEGEDLAFESLHGEWVCHVRSASLEIHTGRFLSGTPRERIEREERAKLRFLAQKLDEDLQSGQRTFVYRTLRGQRGGADGTLGMDEIYEAMRAYGGGGTRLLWVNEAEDGRPHATVEHVRGGLYRGFIRRLTPYDDAHAGDDGAWVDLLRGAQEAMGKGAVTGGRVLQAARV